jgi:hypothetical protein
MHEWNQGLIAGQYKVLLQNKRSTEKHAVPAADLFFGEQ